MAVIPLNQSSTCLPQPLLSQTLRCLRVWKPLPLQALGNHDTSLEGQEGNLSLEEIKLTGRPGMPLLADQNVHVGEDLKGDAGNYHERRNQRLNDPTDFQKKQELDPFLEPLWEEAQDGFDKRGT